MGQGELREIKTKDEILFLNLKLGIMNKSRGLGFEVMV